MAPSSAVILIIASVAFVSSTPTAQYGVGFNLALDYGTSSVYFANGSLIGVAKVEGGSEYKQMMRDEQWKLPWSDKDSWGQSDEEVANIASAGAVVCEQQRLFGNQARWTQGLRDHLPPWLGGPRPDPRIQILQRMLFSLKTATESYLNGEQVVHVGMTFPAQPSDALDEATQAAGKKISLQSLGIGPSSSQFAGYANHVGDPRCTRERLILAVEYSRAALTAFLHIEDCEHFDDVRALHNVTLGSDGSAAVDYDAALVAEIRRIAHLPLQSEDGPVLDHISALVILGEEGRNSRLSAALREVLSEQPHSSGKANILMKERDMADPTFAASMGAAMLSFSKLNDLDGLPPVQESGHRAELRK